MSGDMSGRVPVLRARGLTLRYPGADAAVFQDVNLDLARGEVLAVLGASGAGKSSLLRVLAGLQAPSAGALDMEGQRLAGVHPRVAVAFQDPGLLPWLTLERNVAFGLDFKHQPALDARERARRVDLAIEEVGLSHARQLRPAQLSGGMAQRTALARCLARQPAVLLLDEPFGALDEVTRAEMQTLLRKVVADVGAAALLITHDIDEALLLADRMVLLGARPAACWANGPWTCRSRAPTCCPKWRAAPGNTVPPARRAAGRTRGVRTGGTCLTLIRARHKEPRNVPGTHVASRLVETDGAAERGRGGVVAVRFQCARPGRARRAGAHRLSADHRRRAAAGGAQQRPVRQGRRQGRSPRCCAAGRR